MILFITVTILFIISLYLLFETRDTGFYTTYNMGYICMTFIFGFCFIMSIIIISFIQIPKKADYYIMIEERNVLVEKLKRIQNSDTNDYILNGEIGSLEKTYDDIITFNNRVLNAKYLSDNLILNWYVNKDIGDIEIIKMEAS